MADRIEKSAAPGSARARRSAVADPAPLPLSFYDRPADVVARELIGALIVSHVGGVRVAGEIVETEAYTGPDDEASHAHIRFGRTERNDPMFCRAGTAYVYLIYGMHWCINVATGAEGFPAAVLIRAAIPVDGIEAARERRPGRPDHELMRGPGNLARALGVDRAQNRGLMDGPPLWFAPGRAVPGDEVAAGPRIGITRAADAPLRFWVRGSRYVSGKRS
jgi:DNA-3-methyladenine glycosylase